MRIPKDILARATVTATYPKVKLPRGMNKLEQAYALHLDGCIANRSVLWWGYNCWRLAIATGLKKAWFTPDFTVMLNSGAIEFHETKGSHWREAARVRIKVAASLYPHNKFFAAQRGNPSLGEPPWKFERFTPEPEGVERG